MEKAHYFNTHSILIQNLNKIILKNNKNKTLIHRIVKILTKWFNSNNTNHKIKLKSKNSRWRKKIIIINLIINQN